MLLLIESLGQLDLAHLSVVYRDASDDPYHFYLDFFSEEGNFCAVWVIEGKYCAALRIYKYLDGLLLTALETAPEERRKGYGSSLVREVMGLLQRRGYHKIYSHVDKRNIPSRKLHKKCGFSKVSDNARLLDGTVTTRMDTLCKEI